MSYLPPEKDKSKVSDKRLLLWLVVGGIGVYLVASGLYGVVTGG